MLSGFDTKENLRLVTLSACQTAIPDYIDNQLAPDSFLTEMLKSGAIGAIGTLWEVPDLATSLVLSRIYHYHLKLNQTPSKALQSAQLWLRDLSCHELCLFLQAELTEREDIHEMINAFKTDFSEHEKPFSNPWYWAGFVLVGL